MKKSSRMSVIHPHAAGVDIGAEFPQFGPECTELCNYCLALTQTLAGQGFSSETEKFLSWLLYDLINYFAAEMKARAGCVPPMG
ncbi:Uncharacterised protein [Salmonella enterica subsp. arizonae]|uniref:Uncharacterized protein n=1 Tax=Salmonella enterica subsp. arizonae TaxID=59203 RepID=A0A2X4W2R6_SALER|nr:Uncharacterised protein [Salmonella enterica subsp. arizonae]